MRWNDRQRRRRVVAAVAVVGAGLLRVSLSSRPGSRRFYATSFAIAGLWTAGGLVSGPLHRGWVQDSDEQLRRPVVTPVATGVAAFGLFYACALAARKVGVLDSAISRVLAFAEEGHEPIVLLTALANGLGEEIFFRGALYSALESRPVATTTAVYALATTPTRNPALVLAAGVMGTLFGIQRRASGGLQAPLLTHLTWSALMVRFLPPLFRRAPQE